MRVRGETPDSRKKELKLIGTIANHFNCSFHQLPANSGKYKIDGCLTVNNTVTGWIEAKWYSDGKPAFCYMNASKFNEIISLSSSYKVPSFFVFREQGKWGFIELHNGETLTFTPVIKICGGTPVHRKANDDDIEPLVILPKQLIQWGN